MESRGYYTFFAKTGFLYAQVPFRTGFTVQMNIFQYYNFATCFLISVLNSGVRLSYRFKWAYEGLKTDNAMNHICERQVDSWNDEST